MNRFLRRAPWLLVCASIAFFIGPSVIRSAYRRVTPEKEKEEKKQRYHYLENAELSMAEAARLRSQSERVQLFYWFHSRGWGIDEGHEGPTTFNDWRELIRYWTQNEKRG